jgi:hypothetical protein
VKICCGGKVSQQRPGHIATFRGPLADRPACSAGYGAVATRAAGI